MLYTLYITSIHTYISLSLPLSLGNIYLYRVLDTSIINNILYIDKWFLLLCRDGGWWLRTP